MPKNKFDDLFQNVSKSSPGAFSGIATVVDQVITKTKRQYGMVSLSKLRPNPRQPRQHFDPVKLEELGNSIVEHGLLEPLVVRVSKEAQGYFEIACGERRWKAMQLKNIQEAEAILLSENCSDDEIEQIALIENVQREDLSPYELALAYDRLHKDNTGKPKRSILEVAQLVNQPKSAVDDHLALLRVPEEVRQLIIDDPTLPLRIIRDLGNVENPDDRLYLADEVRAGNLTSNGLTKVLQQLKKALKPSSVSTVDTSSLPSAYADVGETVPSRTSSGTEKSLAPSVEAPEVPSAYADAKEPNPSSPLLDQKKSSVPSQSTSSVPNRRVASPVVALATLEQKLSRDEGTLRKMTERLKEALTEMTHEEKARVYAHVSQWRIWIEDILDLTEQSQASSERPEGDE